jgi:hypothetical protein
MHYESAGDPSAAFWVGYTLISNKENVSNILDGVMYMIDAADQVS